MSKMALRVVFLLLVATLIASAAPVWAAGPFQFHAITPCRLVDTRSTNPPAVQHNTTRNFTVQGVCGVPSGAKAVALNVTIASPNSDGYLTLWAAGGSQPIVSNINFVRNEPALANGAIVPLAASTPDLAVFAAAPFPTTPPGQVHVILDVTGYFQ